MSMRLKIGTGAECSVLIKMLHPSKLVADTLINRLDNERLLGLLAIRKEVRRVNRKDKTCIVFRHDQFPNQELYCCAKFCKVVKEGSPTDYFDEEELVPASTVEVTERAVNYEQPEELQADYEHFHGTAEDIAMMIGMGFDVDDDNAPAPENIPEAANQNEEASNNNGLYQDQSWGWDGVCDRRSRNQYNCNPSL